MTMPSEPALTARRAPRWMWIALVISVALNLLVVGVVAAAMFHFRSRGWDREAGFANYVSSLPAERRTVMSELLEAQRTALRPLRRQSRAARAQVRGSLTNEPFDRTKLDEALNVARQARSALDQARGDWIARIAEQMSAEERRGFTNWRDRHRHGRWRHHGAPDERD